MLNIYTVKIGHTAREFFAKQAAQKKYTDCFYALPGRFLMGEVKKLAAIQVGNLDELVYQILQTATTAAPHPISRYMQILLTGKVIKELCAANQLQYFSKVAEDNNFINAAANLLGELVTAQINPADFLDRLKEALSDEDSRTILNADKLLDLVKIYKAYNTALVSMDKVDIFGCYLQAAEYLRKEDLQLPWSDIYISDYYDFNFLETEIIKKLARHVNVHLALTHEPNRRAAFQSINMLYDSLLGYAKMMPASLTQAGDVADPLRYLADNLFNTQAEPYAADANQVTLAGFYEPQAQLQYLTDDIKKQLLAGAQAEDFLVCVRALDDYPELGEFFERAGILSSLPLTLRVTKHFICGLVMEYLSFALHSFDKNQLRKVLLAPNISEALQIPRDNIEKLFYENSFTSFSELYKLLNKSDLAESVERIRVLESLLTSIPAMGTVRTYAEHIHALFTKLPLLTHLGRKHKQGLIPLSSLKAALAVYDIISSTLSEMDEVLTALYGSAHRLKLSEFLRDFNRALQNKTVIVTEGRQQAVRIISAADIQGIKAKYVYILGLNEGVFPKQPKENWLLSTAEQFALRLADTAASEKAGSEDAFFFAGALAMAKQHLTLTYLENENTRKSKYLFEIERLLPQATIFSSRRMLTDRLDEVYDRYTLNNLLAYYCSFNADKTPLVPAANYLSRIIPLSCIPTAMPSENIRQLTISNLSERVFSITQLETYAQCPFKYFMQYLLHTKAWQLYPEDNTALTKGNFFHKIAEEFMQLYLKRPLPTMDAAQSDLKHIFDRLFDGVITENTYTWQLERNKTYGLLLKWLRTEWAAFGSYRPYKVEWAFGRGTVPVTIGNIRLEGKIDRIDTDGSHLRLTDYKLGNFPNAKGFFENTIDLQMPVYMIIAQQLLNQPVTYCNYYSFRKGSLGEYINTTQADYNYERIYEYIHDVLSKIMQRMAQGDFQPTVNPGCPYCDYLNICRADASAAAESEAIHNE